MNLASMIEALERAGVEPEKILAAIKDVSGARSSGAERQARYRARRRDESVTSDVTGVTLRDSDAVSPSSFPPKPPHTTPPSEITPGPLKGSSPPSDDPAAEQSSDEVQQAVDEWNELAVECRLPTAQRLNASRLTRLRARLRECDGIEGWRCALAKIRGSPFLRGQNDRGWRADLNFLLQESSFTKLMEGSYDRAECDGNGPNGKPPRTQQSDRRAILEGLGLAADGGQFDRNFGSDGGFAPGGY